MNDDLPNISVETLGETESYTIWSADEPDDETTYHVELGPVTAHFFTEEWADFLELIREAIAEEDESSTEDVEVELDWGSLYFTRDEWNEFVRLIEQVE